MIDPETNLPHEAPLGMEHHGLRKKGNKNAFFVNLPISHYIIKKHQELYPELAEKMNHTPKATAIYCAFLALLPVEASDRLTPDEKEAFRKKVYKTLKII